MRYINYGGVNSPVHSTKTVSVPTANKTVYLPEQSSGVSISQKTATVNLTPDSQASWNSMTAIKCSQTIEFPNAQVGENLLAKYTELVQRTRNQAEKKLETANTIVEWSNLVWQAGFVILQYMEPTGLGSAVWGFLYKNSSEGYSTMLSQLQQEVQNGTADPEIVLKLAVISGATDEESKIRQAIYGLPMSQMSSRLQELQGLRQRIVNTMGVISSLFDSVGYQIGYYYALTTIDMNLKAICDRMQGVDPSVPQVILTTPALPPPADIKTFVPSGVVAEVFNDPSRYRKSKKGKLLLLGLAAAIGGALLL
mgnify:CR=1 FL=1